MKYLVCEHCGKMVEVVKDSPVSAICCGQAMKELVPASTDGAFEKHVPVVKTEGNLVEVSVGEVEHPMMEAHYIEWITLETKAGNQRKTLKPGDAPKASFLLTEGDEVIAAYAYCNLHGLWMK